MIDLVAPNQKGVETARYISSVVNGDQGGAERIQSEMAMVVAKIADVVVVFEVAFIKRN